MSTITIDNAFPLQSNRFKFDCLPKIVGYMIAKLSMRLRFELFMVLVLVSRTFEKMCIISKLRMNKTLVEFLRNILYFSCEVFWDTSSVKLSNQRPVVRRTPYGVPLTASRCPGKCVTSNESWIAKASDWLHSQHGKIYLAESWVSKASNWMEILHNDQHFDIWPLNVIHRRLFDFWSSMFFWLWNLASQRFPNL